MATFKFTSRVSKFRDKLIEGMVANGYEQEFAEPHLPPAQLRASAPTASRKPCCLIRIGRLCFGLAEMLASRYLLCAALLNSPSP